MPTAHSTFAPRADTANHGPWLWAFIEGASRLACQAMPASNKNFLEGPAGVLEAITRHANHPKGLAVFCHPHPQYGGTMHNPVIFHSDRSLAHNGWSTLRFNFRGVGKSEGVYDNGRGEIEDVAAAVRAIRQQSGALPLILIGYSFGARMSLSYALQDPDVTALILLGLPLTMYAFDDLQELARPLTVIQGTQDEFGTIAQIRKAMENVRPSGDLVVVPGAEHLFTGRAREVGALVVDVAGRYSQEDGLNHE